MSKKRIESLQQSGFCEGRDRDAPLSVQASAPNRKRLIGAAARHTRVCSVAWTCGRGELYVRPPTWVRSLTRLRCRQALGLVTPRYSEGSLRTIPAGWRLARHPAEPGVLLERVLSLKVCPLSTSTLVGTLRRAGRSSRGTPRDRSPPLMQPLRNCIRPRHLASPWQPTVRIPTQ